MKQVLSSILLCLVAGVALAEGVVVVHPSNAASLNQEDISRLFLGKVKTFSSGQEVTPLNQKEGTPLRDQFDEKVLGKNSSQLKAYWSKLVFTGKGTPPAELADDAAVKAAVAGDVEAIGYIDAAALDSSVKEVMRF